MSTLGVDIAIFDDQNQILLTHRQDFPIWCLPGGGVDPGESISDAASRETEEETGLHVELLRIVGIYSRPQWWEGGGHAVVFEARILGGALKPENEEVQAAQFFPIDQLPENLLWWHRQCIQDAHQRIHAIACTQNAIWSQPMPRSQAIQQLPKEYFVDLFCQPPDRPHLIEVDPGVKFQTQS